MTLERALVVATVADLLFLGWLGWWLTRPAVAPQAARE